MVAILRQSDQLQWGNSIASEIIKLLLTSCCTSQSKNGHEEFEGLDIGLVGQAGST
jgi:hypothetical protein